MGQSRIYVSALMSLLLSGVAGADIPGHVDFSSELDEFLSGNAVHWVANTPASNGYIRPNLDRDWSPLPAGSNILISHDRQMYVCSTAYGLTGDPAYLAFAEQGAALLTDIARDPVYGGYYWQWQPDGTIVDTKKDAYGQAHTLYTLTHLYRVSRDPAYLAEAQHAFDTLTTHFKDGYNGYLHSFNREMTTSLGGVGLNHVMHIFESFTTLYEVSGDPAARSEAHALGEFIVNTMYRDHAAQSGRGYIPDVYDYVGGAIGWAARPVASGGYVNLGHNIEMTFLLSRAAELGVAGADEADWLTASQKVQEFVFAHGYDPAGGGLFHPNCDYDGNLNRPNDSKTWWPQTELMRACLHWSVVRGAPGLWGMYDQTDNLCDAHFIDAVYGGWLEGYDGRFNTQDKSDKGTIWKGGYHETMLYAERLRLSWTPGDADLDETVDVSDLGILAGNWGRTDAAGWVHADFTGDGLVDVGDLGILAGNWGASSAVPEPGSLLLLSAGLLAGLGIRRK